ncbi:MAG TPA: DUF2314 domain-containing protein, partial [Rhodocyclaceae bacterium]|nr:DUF2314 domain-containing protein [Rhodocyclaceae bacterium]
MQFLVRKLVLFCLLGMVMHASAKLSAEDFPAGSPVAERVHFQLAIYYSRTPKADPLALFRSKLAKLEGAPLLVAKLPEDKSRAYVLAQLEKNVQGNYRPPDLQSLQYFGRGLSRKQAEDLQGAKQALVLDFVHPKKRILDVLRTASQLIEDLARESNGLIWDEETREVFTPDEWHARRVETLRGEFPDVSKQTVIHAYKNDEFVRAITLGMAKFGLPDVVVEGFSWSSNKSIGTLINLFSQAMAEGAVITKAGEFDLVLKSIRNPSVREAQLQTLKPNAAAVAYLGLRKAVPDEGDPQNRLVQIGFDRYEGVDTHARRDKMISSLFGWEDSIVRIKHNEALLAASQAAKAKLPALKKDFLAGLRPGEFIQVKAPFPTPKGGSEWMWVEVSAWKAGSIEGLLKNEPFDIPTLHAGQMVTVKEN